MISSVSSANYYVNEDTSHKNITDWIKNNAKTGDNLIFNTSSYNLTDRLNITKSINIKSNKNTQINFIQQDEMYCMFYVTAKNVVFSGLTINHNGNGNTQEYSSGEWGTTINGFHMNIKNTVINTNLIYGASISFRKGSIVNCTINSKSQGIQVSYWKGNIINSRINANEGITNRIALFHNVDYWYGDMANTTIVSGNNGVELTVWKGKIINSTIRTNGSKAVGINIQYGEGRIHGSKIISVDGYAVKISDAVKITNSSLSSRKGLSKSVRYLPDLKVSKAFISGRTCYITISNIGFSTSKPTRIGLKIGKVLIKAHVKSIKPFIPQEHSPDSWTKHTTKVKITLPKKYTSGKYLKTVKVDYYNKIKETNKKNNILKFR
ncbi:MAG: hypothetical protein LBU74_05840 [Methanobacteriaceae archaeon]|jgi:hypothetical protein|nr:hypothetical protein [Candidatus Methanorudis spinitermitis]